ncbi:hypothetical protein ScPMuIL_016818 [Solemya velum]
MQDGEWRKQAVKVELIVEAVGNSAAPMTSDRGTNEGAELDIPTPVTPKSPGLNPNATEFLSSKAGDTTPPSDTGQWDGVAANEYQFANGEVGTGEEGGGTTPPADSPIPTGEFSAFTDSPLYPNDSGITADYLAFIDGEGGTADLPDDQIRQLLKEHLEMYFSRDNLASDSYLQSQMDADQYVPMATVAKLSHIQQLTNNLNLIVEVLRESQCVQVDEKGEKVRPNHNRCIVILREVPDNTPVKDVAALFTSENCPPFVSCEFAHNNNWYVTFDSDSDAQTAYQYLREEVQTFLGKPIMARIKAKPLIRMTYPRNGYVKRYAQPQVQPTAPPEQQPAQQQFQVPQQITFVPNVQQYLQNGNQTIPFYPPSPAILPSWPPTSPTTIIDPSMMLHMNGYHATSVKINATQNRHPFTNARNKNQKPHRQSNMERVVSDRSGHDRHQGGGSHRTSPRGGSDNSQISGPAHTPFQNRRGDNSGNHAHIVHPTAPNHMTENNSNMSANNRQSDQMRKSYRSRRRQNDEGPKPPRINSGPTGREGRLGEVQFDLEHTSFPPLPGSSSNTATEDVFESKLSDVVKGTAKGQFREKPTVAATQSPITPATVTPSKDTTINNNVSNGVPAPPSSSPPPPPVQIPQPVSPQKSIKPTQPTVTTVHTLPERKATPPAVHHVTPVSPPAPENHSTPKAVHVSNHHVKMDTEPVRFTYAQMVARGKDSDSSSDDCKDPVLPSSAKTNQTLKEQSQTKVPPHNDNTSSKDQTRKELEPKEQRYTSTRRAKENRERKERRREREREAPKALGK